IMSFGGKKRETIFTMTSLNTFIGFSIMVLQSKHQDKTLSACWFYKAKQYQWTKHALRKI
ncbi:hypothetical protein S245_041461, partial [Arachis hypogaea]